MAAEGDVADARTKLRRRTGERSECGGEELGTGTGTGSETVRVEARRRVVGLLRTGSQNGRSSGRVLSLTPTHITRYAARLRFRKEMSLCLISGQMDDALGTPTTRATPLRCPCAGLAKRRGGQG